VQRYPQYVYKYEGYLPNDIEKYHQYILHRVDDIEKYHQYILHRVDDIEKYHQYILHRADDIEKYHQYILYRVDDIEDSLNISALFFNENYFSKGLLSKKVNNWRVGCFSTPIFLIFVEIKLTCR